MNRNSLNLQKRSAIVKNIASDLGFDQCGISHAGFLEEQAKPLENWLKNDYHGQMGYMTNHFDKRLDPRLLVPGAKSVISVSYNYFNENWKPHPENKTSMYAAGTDYHYVIKDKLRSFLDQMNEQIGEIGGRVFVDSAPVLERAWAAKSGLGWIAKNSMLLSKNKGSFFFLAQLIVDVELAEDKPVTDHCGECTACIDACPTEAIVDSKIIDSNKCISYLTIELREAIPEKFKGKMDNWAFGCDVCQDVCPWNRFSTNHNEPLFNSNGIDEIDSREWMEMTNSVFKKKFKSSAISRTGLKGMKRNIDFLNTA